MIPRATAPALLALLCSCGSADPEITSVGPERISARGGETLTLRGSGFAEGSKVRIGGEPCAAVEVVSGEEIRCTTPLLYAGPAGVSVEVAGGETANLAGALTVLALDLRFTEAPPYALPLDTAEAIAGAALADFDGDGDPDLLTCSPAMPCRFLENGGRGSFTSSPSGKSGPRFPMGEPDTRAVVAADFDADGALDLFLGVAAGGPGQLLRNDGSGAFAAQGPLAFGVDEAPVTVAAAGDIDGDGRVDLVIAGDAGGELPVRVHLGRSAGGHLSFVPLAAAKAPTGDWAVTALALADLDGDGRVDILATTPGAADGVGLRFLRNGKSGFEDLSERLPTSAGAPAAIAAGDVNGDGAVDLVLVGAGQDRLLLNDGSGHFFDATAGALPLDASQGTSVTLVDLDRDRDLDLVIGNLGGQVRLHLNDGTGRFLDHTPLLPLHVEGTFFVAAADVDGDQDQDLLVLNASPDPARLYISVEPPSHEAP